MDTVDHILIVDDDVEICRLLQAYLQQNGFKASVAHDGSKMWQILDLSRIDLLILDVMLPGEDGLTLCRNLRTKSNIPVIMLTARGDEMDRIVGLEMGADDYIAKPFSARELLARIKGVLRRTRTLPPNSYLDEGKNFTVYQFEGWTLDTAKRHLVSGQRVVTPLSSSEYRLLMVFLTHPNHILNRDQLLDLTQGKESNAFDRSIDVQVSRLRARLGDDPREPRLIKTVRSEGYVWSVPVEKTL